MVIIGKNEKNMILINWLMKENGRETKLCRKGHVIHSTMHQPIFRILYMIHFYLHIKLKSLLKIDILENLPYFKILINWSRQKILINWSKNQIMDINSVIKINTIFTGPTLWTYSKISMIETTEMPKYTKHL